MCCKKSNPLAVMFEETLSHSCVVMKVSVDTDRFVLY